jgi:uncharacterized protein (UPF0332 family)
LSFDWQEYANLANKLASDEAYHKEGRLRAASSRVYYAAHWQVQTHLKRENPSLVIGEGKNVHREVIRLCIESQVPALEQVGQHLSRMLECRVDADYKNWVDFREGRFGLAMSCFGAICGMLNKRTASPKTKT